MTENDKWNDCMDRIGAIFSRCMHTCNDNQSCENDCVMEFKESKKTCPCEVGRGAYNKQGNNTVQEKCPAGCPCNSLDCDEIPSNVDAVLVLDTSNDNIPFIVDFQGRKCYNTKALVSDLD